MPTYKTPGVYVEEISLLPPSVAQVETAIPAFIGNTQSAASRIAGDLHLRPTRISSLVEYEQFYGRANDETIAVAIDANDRAIVTVSTETDERFRMYYALQLYFANGGGPCYIVSSGTYDNGLTLATNAVADTPAHGLQTALNTLDAVDEPTILYFPDAIALDDGDYTTLYDAALLHCSTRGDRVLICDVKGGQEADLDLSVNNSGFRSLIGTTGLSYGAAYYPFLVTPINYAYNEAEVDVSYIDTDNNETSGMMDTLVDEADTDKFYHIAKDAIAGADLVMPPGAAIAGVYAHVDRTRGVWKAPANVSLKMVSRPLVPITRDMNDRLNVDTSGKSVNAIRFFPGKGNLVWGARTLAGNDNDWRYISSRRFYNMVEESTAKASAQFVFEPNNADTWNKVRGMIENFLILQWRDGALQGAKPEDAFYVRCGLNQTMTSLDVLEGRMIVEIGMAVVRPAEFIVLRFSHLLAQS